MSSIKMYIETVSNHSHIAYKGKNRRNMCRLFLFVILAYKNSMRSVKCLSIVEMPKKLLHSNVVTGRLYLYCYYN